MTALDKILDWKLGTNTNNNATGFLVTSDDFKDGQQELASLRSENERLKAENEGLKQTIQEAFHVMQLNERTGARAWHEPPEEQK